MTKLKKYIFKRYILVKPKMNYPLTGTDSKLNKNKIYTAEIAANQPDYEKKGKIVVKNIILERGEYTIIK